MNIKSIVFCGAAFAVTGMPTLALANNSDKGIEAVAEAESGEVKGVNPADIFSRADLILKAVNLSSGESITAVAKYDKKLGEGLGANIELPFASYVNVGAADAFGIGDLFARVRYVKPLSQSVIALASAELVAPTATNDLLGTGKWQLNPGGGLVKIWSPKMFTAIVYKHSFSIAGDSARASINTNQIRAIQSFILNRGAYFTVDGRHEWKSSGINENWTTGEIEFGKQFDASFAASVRIGKAFGDRKNDGSIEFNVRTFF
jgi:hypothetical protein